MRHIPTAIAAFIGLAILSVVLGSWYTVDEGNVASFCVMEPWPALHSRGLVSKFH